MSIEDQRRAKFEQAVIDRMKEGGYLEVEIRTECLVRSGDGYYDCSVDAYWHFWNAALGSVVVELPEGEWLGEVDPEFGLNEDKVRSAIEAAGMKVKA